MENNVRVSSGAITDRGLSEKRPQNEDAFLEIAKCGIFAVADGVGGAQAGEVASQMAMEILGEAFTNRAAEADAEVVMRTAFERANTAIFQMAHELPQLATMATTIVALHVDGNIATIGHVGDSRLYRVDRDGVLYRETDDHSMVGEEVRAGRMTEEQAETHPSRNIISRALGAEPDVSIDLKTIMIDPGTAFLICSDGITRHVGDQEIKGVLTFGGTPDEICDYLKNLCYDRGAEDNLTAVVVKVAGIGNAAAASAQGFHDHEEPTVASARAAAVPIAADEDEEDLLGLETLQMDWPDAVSRHAEDEKTLEDFPSEGDEQETVETKFLDDDTDFETEENVRIDTTPATSDRSAQPEDLEEPTEAIEHEETDSNVEHVDQDADRRVSHFEGMAGNPDETPQELSTTDTDPPIVPATAPQQVIPSEVRTTFEDAHAPEHEKEAPGSISRMAAAVGLLLLGSLVGLGVSYFAFSPTPTPTAGNPLSGMKSDNIDFSNFEKNRRNVDADPVGYLRELPQAEDAEDYYLMGRAYLLKGEVPQAQAALVDAQKLVLASPTTNTKVLAADIAMALMIANDPTLQPRLRNQIDSALGLPTNTAPPINFNSNR